MPRFGIALRKSSLTSFAASLSLLTLASWGAAGCAVEPESLTLSLGEAEVLVPEGTLPLSMWPSDGISVLPATETAKTRLVVAGLTSTFLVEGADLRSLNHATEVMKPGEPNAFDNGAAGMGAIYTAADGTLYGFYTAEDHEGLLAQPNGLSGVYASIGLALSTDGGTTWTKQGQVITSKQTKGAQLAAKESAGGVGDPGLAVSRDGRYLYLYFAEYGLEDNRGVQICMARADLQEGPPAPGRFLKYNGLAFGEPGLAGRCDPVINGIGLNYASVIQPHVTYSPYAGRYLAVFAVVDWLSLSSGDGLGASGLSYATSLDGLRWSSLSRLLADRAEPLLASSFSGEGTIVWDELLGASSGQTGGDAGEAGKEGWLLYGSSPSWGPPPNGLPHTLTARRLSLAKN